MGVPLVRRGGWAQIVHLITTTAFFFSFKALCYENTNQKKKTFGFSEAENSVSYIFFTLNILVKNDCHFLKHVCIHMERTVGIHAVYTVPTRPVTD